MDRDGTIIFVSAVAAEEVGLVTRLIGCLIRLAVDGLKTDGTLAAAEDIHPRVVEVLEWIEATGSPLLVPEVGLVGDCPLADLWVRA